MAVKKDIFKTWKDEQDIYGQISISSMKKHLEKRNVNRMKRKFSFHLSDAQTIAGMFDPKLSDFLQDYKMPSSKELESRFLKMYSLLEGDIDTFISHLVDKNFKSKRLNSVEKKQGVNAVVKKYTDIFDYLFDQEDDDDKDVFLFSVANKFFEYCFYPKTFPKFKKLLSSPDYHPIVRLLYSIIWTNLAEIGWQHWHVDVLCELRKHADKGKQIVYIAGGTDVYQMIKHGIYNIHVIDPLLPSQPKYYSQGWSWFIKGKGAKDGVGERVVVKFGNKKITMERASFKKTGKSFTMQLSTNKKETIEESITTWHLYGANKKLLGKLVFDRRLTNQDDFAYSPKRTVLISFNELYFVAAPKKQDGWGINPHKFDNKLNIIVKQLQKSVNKQIVCNIRYEVKQTDFAFISLGSCVD